MFTITNNIIKGCSSKDKSRITDAGQNVKMLLHLTAIRFDDVVVDMFAKPINTQIV